MAARASEALGGSTVGISSAVAVDVSGADANFDRVTRGVYIAAAGNLVVQFVGDNTSVTLAGLAPGVWHAMQLQKIISASTTATGIVVGY